MSLAIRPITITQALKWNLETHRRRPRLQGAMWAVAVERAGVVVGVAIVGRPARLIDDGHTLTVARVAVVEGDAAPNGNKGACSKLYGACARAAKAMCARLFTYTDLDEPGTSLRAAGWIDDGETRGGVVDGREGRQLEIEPCRKRRWRAP